jgi:hypothetical protein
MVLVYLWGTWGGGVFARRCLPLATVCDCPQWGRYGRACREPAKVVIFEGFARRDMYSFVAGVALGDIPTCEIACRKSLCVTGAILLNDFRKITVQWHWCVFLCGGCGTWQHSHVLMTCVENPFVWPAKYSWMIFVRLLSFFVASAALQRCLFLVAGTVLYTCGVVCICKSYWNCLCIHIKWQKGNVLTLFSDCSNHPVWFPRH